MNYREFQTMVHKCAAERPFIDAVDIVVCCANSLRAFVASTY